MTGKVLPLLVGTAVFVGLQTGCERHPASQTVPNYNETQARERERLELESRTPIVINPDAPKFFPEKKE